MPRRHRDSSILGAPIFAFLFAAMAWSQPAAAPKYRDPKLTIDERVADLLSRMTLEEKVAEIGNGDNPSISLLDTTGTYRPDQARPTFRRASLRSCATACSVICARKLRSAFRGCSWAKRCTDS
jgi:hypothetical protein